MLSLSKNRFKKGNILLILGAYAPFSQKINFKTSKKIRKKIFACISSYFMLTYNLIQKGVAKRLILVPGFFHFI
jgi:hypothetical protein